MLASGAVVGLHLLLAHADYDPVDGFLAGVCGALALNVIWSYFARTERKLPVLEWVVLQLYVFFAMPVYFKGESTMSVPFQVLSRTGTITSALLAAVLFLSLVLAGWALIPAGKPKQRRESPRDLPLGLLLTYAVGCIMVAFALTMYEVETAEAWYRSILWLVFSPMVAQMLLLFEMQSRPGNDKVKLAVLCITAVLVLQGLVGSRLSQALIPILNLGIAMVCAKREVPRSLVVLALVMLVLFNPAKLVYRNLTGYRTDAFSSLSFTEAANAWAESLRQTWAGDEEETTSAFEKTAARLSNLTINAAVINWTPGRVAYARGEPWLAIPYSVVPRFLWPEKPNMTKITNTAFASTFRLSFQPETSRGTAAYPAIADGYWNFGWLGVALAGLVAGLFWKSIFLLWSEWGRFRYVLAFFVLMNTRAPVAMPGLLGGVFQTAVACAFVVVAMETMARLLRKTRI